MIISRKRFNELLEEEVCKRIKEENMQRDIDGRFEYVHRRIRDLEMQMYDLKSFKVNNECHATAQTPVDTVEGISGCL